MMSCTVTTSGAGERSGGAQYGTWATSARRRRQARGKAICSKRTLARFELALRSTSTDEEFEATMRDTLDLKW